MIEAGSVCCPQRCAELPEDDTLVQNPTTDGDTFEHIVAQHQARLRQLAYRLLGWDGSADDIVQEVFLAALQNIATFEARGSMESWLNAITINKCRSYQRKQSWRRRLLQGFRPPATAPPPPDASALQAETSEHVRRAVRSLPHRLREVVVLRYLEELDTRQVARTVGITQNTVEVRLHRARQRLNHLLDPPAQP